MSADSPVLVGDVERLVEAADWQARVGAPRQTGVSACRRRAVLSHRVRVL